MTKAPKHPAAPAPMPLASRNLKRLTALFYSTAAGNMPARDWLRGLEETDRRKLGKDLLLVEMTWPVPPPLVKSLKPSELWEIRDRLENGNEARLLFAIDGSLAVVLHGFEKKTRQTPQMELETAEGRWTKYKEERRQAAREEKRSKK